MPDFDLTGNDWVAGVPVPAVGDSAFQQWCVSRQFGLDGGPYSGYNEGNMMQEWSSLTPYLDKGFYNRGWCAKGLGTEQEQYSGATMADYRFGYWGGAINPDNETLGDWFVPPNMSVFTGDSDDNTMWRQAGYSAGVWNGSNNGRFLPLNTDGRTTYTIITPEFSYNPKYWLLPSLLLDGFSHRFVFNISVPWVTMRGGRIGEWAGAPLNITNTFPHPDTDAPIVGIILERSTWTGNLQLRYNIPTEPDWVTTQGTAILGQAINHTPPDTTQQYWDATDYLVDTDQRLIGGRDIARIRTGYVTQVFLSEDRTMISVRFNGTTVFPDTRLPDSVISYLKRPPHTETDVDNLTSPFAGLFGFPPELETDALSAGWTQEQINGWGSPRMGIGMALFTNLIPDPSFNPQYWGEQNNPGVFTLLKVTKNRKPNPDPTGTGILPTGDPFHMARPDGLVSAPPWANLGSGWGAMVDRAALWQRNNPR